MSQVLMFIFSLDTNQMPLPNLKVGGKTRSKVANLSSIKYLLKIKFNDSETDLKCNLILFQYFLEFASHKRVSSGGGGGVQVQHLKTLVLSDLYVSQNLFFLMHKFVLICVYLFYTIYIEIKYFFHQY